MEYKQKKCQERYLFTLQTFIIKMQKGFNTRVCVNKLDEMMGLHGDWGKINKCVSNKFEYYYTFQDEHIIFVLL